MPLRLVRSCSAPSSSVNYKTLPSSSRNWSQVSRAKGLHDKFLQIVERRPVSARLVERIVSAIVQDIERSA